MDLTDRLNSFPPQTKVARQAYCENCDAHLGWLLPAVMLNDQWEELRNLSKHLCDACLKSLCEKQGLAMPEKET